MICYLDRAFCSDTDRCGTTDCHRRVTDAVKRGAAAKGLPLALADLWDTCTRRSPHTETSDA